MITKYLSSILIICYVFFSCSKVKKEDKKQAASTTTASIKVKSLTYSELKPFLEKKDNKTYVINFWATWCGPCVKELPYFERINKQYTNKNVEVLLVSLDFPKQLEKQLIPFIKKNKLQSKVVLLDDVNENYWIKAIDSTWTGAIPATIIYNKNSRKFYEKSFDYKALEKELQFFIN
jgi:thiol-disulfide isomerase/thioredoxin